MRVKLERIKAARSEGYITLVLTDGADRSTLTVTEADYAAVGSPLIGAEISDADLSALTYSDAYYRATVTALSILSYGDNSRRTLLAKLASRSYSREICEAVVADMVARGYVDEQRQLFRLVEREANGALLGRRRIVYKLASRGYPPAAIVAVIDRLTSSGEIDFEANKQALIEKKLTRGATSEQIEALLYKFGY